MKGRTSRSNTARHMPRYACALLARRKRAVCIFWPPSDWVLKTRRKAGWDHSLFVQVEMACCCVSAAAFKPVHLLHPIIKTATGMLRGGAAINFTLLVKVRLHGPMPQSGPDET